MGAAIRVRVASPADYCHYLRLYALLGMDDTPVDAAGWAARMAPETFFVEEQGRVVAYGYGQVLDECAYVRHVAVDSAARGRGHGRRIMNAMLARARAARARVWRLNVMAQNEVARDLYRSLGFEDEYVTRVQRFPWSKVSALPSADPTTIVAHAPEARDAELERALDQPRGLLASLRANPDTIILEARNAEERLLGALQFDPRYPGCFPFQAADMETARALLEFLATYRPAAGPDWVQLVIERDERSADQLESYGGAPIYLIQHMRALI